MDFIFNMYNSARQCQIDINNDINKLFDISNNDPEPTNKGLVKAFCGIGKSFIMTHADINQFQKLICIIMPTLQLCDQYYNDYLIPNIHHHKKRVLRISSDNDTTTGNKSTTDEQQIIDFINNTHNTIRKTHYICVTYQSLHLLTNILYNPEKNIHNTKIDIAWYDEAHRAIGEQIQQTIFSPNINNIIDKQIFLTATPKNANGITMYDSKLFDNSSNHCGNKISDYTYLNGKRDGYLNDFNINIDMFSNTELRAYNNNNKPNYNIYECIIRAILTSGNGKVLTFHSDVNTDKDTSVKNFVNIELFKEVWNKMLTDEEINNQENNYVSVFKYATIHFVCLDSSIPIKQRNLILKDFDNTLNSPIKKDIYIISSCKTIGEGIDTKRANMCVFVDPKTSYTDIIQNIGRIVRLLGTLLEKLQTLPATILIPTCIDVEQYADCKGDLDKRDEIIRQNMNLKGNFNGILNVLSAIQQEDPELFELCLNYPATFTKKEIHDNLNKQNYKIDEQIGDGNIIESLEHIINSKIDYINNEFDLSDEQILLQIAQQENINIEIHSTSIENPIETFKCNDASVKDTIRLFKEIQDYDDCNTNSDSLLIED